MTSRTRLGTASFGDGPVAAPCGSARTVSTTTNGLPSLVIQTCSASPVIASSLLSDGGERSDQRQRLVLRERRQPQLDETLVAGEIVERAAQDRRAGQVLLAGRAHHEDRPRPKAAPEEGQEAETHLVAPVEILEDQQQRLGQDEMPDELRHALEELAIVDRPPARARSAQLGKKARQLHPIQRIEALREPPLLRRRGPSETRRPTRRTAGSARPRSSARRARGLRAQPPRRRPRPAGDSCRRPLRRSAPRVGRVPPRPGSASPGADGSPPGARQAGARAAGSRREGAALRAGAAVAVAGPSTSRRAAAAAGGSLGRAALVVVSGSTPSSR